MAFAGFWERWHSRDGRDKLDPCTIIVTDANELLAPIHDRMPVILDPGDFDRWLDPGAASDGRTLLRPFPADHLEAYPVSTLINSPRNDDPRLLDPLTA